MTVDFSKLLNKQADQIEKPKPVPPGTYYATVGTHKFGQTTSEKQTPYVEFEIRLTQPDEDVDEEQFAEFGGQEKLGARAMRYTFYLTDDAEWRLVNFFEALGLGTSGRTLGELIPETQGQALKVTVSHSPNQRQPGEVFANITGHASAE